MYFTIVVDVLGAKNLPTNRWGLGKTMASMASYPRWHLNGIFLTIHGDVRKALNLATT